MTSPANTMLERVKEPEALVCPHCHSGSDLLYTTALALSAWESLPCPACKVAFEPAAAIDEMLISGYPEGYALWAGGAHIIGQGKCPQGGTVLLDVRGEIDRIYRMLAPRSGSYLSGGLALHYVQQGFVMAAVAPSPDGDGEFPVELTVHAVGSRPGAAPLEGWREIFLEARTVALGAPKLTVILSVAALDLFFEELASADEIRGNQPGVWEQMYRQATGKSLSEALGGDLKRLGRLLGVRGAMAHGRDYVASLPDDLRVVEQKWIDRGHLYEDRVAPSAVAAMREVLHTTRAALRTAPPELLALRGWRPVWPPN